MRDCMVNIKNLLTTIEELRDAYHFDDSETLVGWNDYDVVVYMQDKEAGTQITITKALRSRNL